MELCFSQPFFLRTLLMLVLSLIQRDNFATAQLCAMVNGRCQLTIGDLFEHASALSDYINIVSSDAFKAFHEKYALDQEFQHKFPLICQNSSLTIPEKKEQVQQIQPEVLLKVIISILSYWNNHLQHLVTEMSCMQESPVAVTSKLRDIKEKARGLLEGIKTILSKVHPGAKEEDYPISSGLETLQATDEESCLFVFQSLLRCLRTDSHKVATFVKFLKCQLVHNSQC